MPKSKQVLVNQDMYERTSTYESVPTVQYENKENTT